MRPREPLDGKSLAFSVGLHVVLLLLAWASTLYSAPAMEFITYEIELVSPPPAVQAEEMAPAVEEMTIERPEPTPPEPQPEPEREQVPVEQKQPDPPKPDPVTEVADDPTPATTTEEPTETAESGENLNVRLEGVRRDYPAYYDNIIRQIFACFRPPQSGNWEATIFFNIQRDGSVSDMRFVKRSGNFEFDFSAMGAVECAGRGRLGPLPEDLPYDRLPIQFDFKPGRELTLFAAVGVGRPTLR